MEKRDAGSEIFNQESLKKQEQKEYEAFNLAILKQKKIKEPVV